MYGVEIKGCWNAWIDKETRLLNALGTFVITVGLAMAILLGFYLMYYLSTIAGTVYDIKIRTIRKVEDRVDEFRGEMEREMIKRSQYISSESRKSINEFREGIRAETDSLREMVDRSLASIESELYGLREAIGVTREIKATGTDNAGGGKVTRKLKALQSVAKSAKRKF